MIAAYALTLADLLYVLPGLAALQVAVFYARRDVAARRHHDRRGGE